MDVDWDEIRGSKEILFAELSYASHREVRRRGKNVIYQVNSLLSLGHEKDFHYLDLALQPCHRYLRADHTRFEVIRSLPLPCAEYLTMDTESNCAISLNRMLWNLTYAQGYEFSEFERYESRTLNEWFAEYLSMFRERFQHQDGIQRKTAIRGMLNAYRCLHITAFRSADFVTWIRECTSPEPDPALTVDLLETLGLEDPQKSKIFFLVPPDCLETMICHAKAMRFDFWGLWRGLDIVSNFYNPVSDYIYDGRNHLAILLLKYGFPFPSAIRDFRLCYSSVIPPSCTVISRIDMYIPRYFHRRFTTEIRKNRPRLIMTIFMAFAPYGEAEVVPVDPVPTLVHLMRSVTDPYVLPEEIDGFLRPYIDEFREEDLETACMRYKEANVYNEDYSVYKPRTLRHLSRCVVRRAIANNLRLPEGVGELKLPRLLEKYLLLEEP